MTPDYKKLYDIVCNLYSGTDHFYYGEWDETFFTVRVFEFCKELTKKTRLMVNKEVLLTAAILHDIGKTLLDTEEKIKNDWDKHPEFGVPIARRILEEQGFSNDFIEQVTYLIKHHDARPHIVQMNRSNELKILQDADLLADMGIAGVVRPFLFSGKNKRKTIENIKYMEDVLNNDLFFSTESFDRFNLKESKKIAKKLMREFKRLTSKIIKLTCSELLEE